MARLALSCTDLGDVLRGVEQHYRDLYEQLCGDLDITLFKGGALGPGVRLPRLSRSSFLVRHLPEGARSLAVLGSYVPFLIVALRKGHFDLVNLSDTRLAKVRKYLPKWALPTRFLFTNAAETPPFIEDSFDYVHCTTPVHHDAALAYGIPPNRVFLIPHGVDTTVFHPVDAEERGRLRSKHGIPQDAFVTVSVGFLGAHSHKRPGWVIDEVAQTGAFLFLVGEQDATTAVLKERAVSALGPARVRIARLPPGEAHEAYQLADLFVLGSLHEAFGIVVIEAMACGLPVIVHNAPTLRWIAGKGGSVIEMDKPGMLAEEIRRYLASPDLTRTTGERARGEVASRFSWDVLKPMYREMLERCARG